MDKITPHNSTLKSPLVTVKMSRSASTDATRVATPPDASVRRKLPDRPGRARSQVVPGAWPSPFDPSVGSGPVRGRGARCGRT